MVGLSVLVYDTERDHVFDMDFEGGDRLLRQGRLEPLFTGSAQFLEWDFEGDGQESPGA